MEKITELLKILGDRNRLRILKMIEYRPCYVCELSHMLEIRQPSVSQHLKKMKDAGLLTSTQDSTWTIYHLNKQNNFLDKTLFFVISEWIAHDPQILSDRQKLEKLNKYSICGKD